MRIEKKKCEAMVQDYGDTTETLLANLYKHIERCGRICYASQPKEDSAEAFVGRMIANGHLSVLEHGTVYLKFNEKEENACEELVRVEYNPYSAVVNSGDEMYVTTNLRAIVESLLIKNLSDDLCFNVIKKYMCAPSKRHEPRYTLKVRTSIGVTREFNRHRVNSISESSTRYCNYSKDKFGKEVAFIAPWWYDREETSDAEREEFRKTAIDSEAHYMSQLNMGYFAERARGALNLDTASTVAYTTSISNWEHFLSLRLAHGAHPDARETANLMFQCLKSHLKGLGKDGVLEFEHFLQKFESYNTSLPLSENRNDLIL